MIRVVAIFDGHTVIPLWLSNDRWPRERVPDGSVTPETLPTVTIERVLGFYRSSKATTAPDGCNPQEAMAALLLELDARKRETWTTTPREATHERSDQV